MRIPICVFVALVLSVPGAGRLQGQAQGKADPDINVQGGVQAPGWQARLDRANQSVNNLKFTPMGGGVHVTTGPAGIFWRPDNDMKGNYQVAATFILSKMPAHQEAYGLFIGGSDLAGDGQRYTYFIIREDGKYMIRRRDGAQTKNVVDWTDHAAVQKPTPQGLKNTLAIQVGSGNVRFLANGTEISNQPRSAVDADGIAGLRVNHNLDVHIDGFRVEKSAS